MIFVPDPVRLEITRSLLEAAAEEMGITLQRVAFSANIKERRDFSCALFDRDGELLAQAAHVPVHLGSMPESVKAVLTRLGPLEDGDVALVNDPFAGGTHLPDITLVSPVFSDRALLGYAANRAHHADVGGLSPGSMTLSTHIDQEGLRIEPTLFHRKGTRDEALLERILDAVRTPQERLGDLDAQLAANTVGARALRRIATRTGVEELHRYGHALLDYSHAFMAKVLASLPVGQWSFEDFMDDDGAGTELVPSAGPSVSCTADARVVIRVTLTNTAGCESPRITLDFSDCPAQVPGCINCPEAVTRSAVYYCFACLLAEEFGEAVPLNAGCFRDLHVLTRPGSVVHATYPAAVVAGNTETSQRIVDVVFGALARALPGRIPAASCGTMSSLALGGSRPSPSAGPERSCTAEARVVWTYYETIGGGSGASRNSDGASAVQCHMTNTLNTPAEALEIQYPLRVLRFERAPGTGGTGTHRGGDGILRELQALEECEGTLLTDRRATRPYEVGDCSSPAAPGLNQIVHSAGRVDSLPGKSHFHLDSGSRLRIRTPGGAGWSI